ncbi:MAG: TraR/DksA C4-type zinc finger protein [Actinomycetia bacterium]|nr:TraR/DksA C4-type zinc finger protein [Actinomycetes bacterium]
MPQFDRDHVAAKLDQERVTVLHQLHELGANDAGELTGEVDFGDAFADAGAATAERTETIGIVESLTRRLSEIDAAIMKLEGGTFGVCSACGKDIETDRLDYRPTSVKCVSCKSAASE